jgi:hypothetical protein
METLGPKKYQEAAVKDLLRYFDTRGKRVLQIGESNWPREFVFDMMQPAQWVTVASIPKETIELVEAGEREPYLDHLREVGISHFGSAKNGFDAPYTIFADPIEDGRQVLESRFDLVLSVAYFQHVINLKEMFEIAYSNLRDQGIIFSQFSPIWSSAVGHHCSWIPNHRLKSAVEQGNGLIPPFGHLIYTEDDMKTLLSKCYDQNDLDWIIDSIYKNAQINKLFFDDYFRIFLQSDFKMVDFRGRWVTPIDNEVRVILENKFPGRAGFEFEGLTFVGMKDQEEKGLVTTRRRARAA